MDKEQVKNFKKWFNGYVNGFYNDDEFLNANIKLKQDHSNRVVAESNRLCGQLDITGNDKLIAETAAVFHDIGRFRQFAEHNTYNDHKSINHCQLGVEVLNQTEILKDIDLKERQLIETAVLYHGVKELTNAFSDKQLLFLKLVRDADKLDIYKVVINYTKQYLKDPENFKIELELPDVPQYSQKVADLLLQNSRIDYSELKTLNDMRLIQISWVFDVNFKPTFQRIRHKKYLEQIIENLPDDEKIREITSHIFNYVNNRICDGI